MESINITNLQRENRSIFQNVILFFYEMCLVKCTECSCEELIGKSSDKFSSLDMQENKTLVYRIVRSEAATLGVL